MNPEFQGRVAFNVLGDMSRFSFDAISKIEKIEIFLQTISSTNLKLLCTFKMGDENDSSKRMLKMAMSNHDYAFFENDDGSFSEKAIN